MSPDYLTDLLLVVPHPDDEVFGLGAMLARMAAAGRVATLTLTRGAAGKTLGLATRAELPNVRERDLRASLAALGVQDVTILDHQDYVPDDDRGMPRHPGLAGADRAALLAEIEAVLARTRPRVVFTFAPNGSNGHPDHCLTSELTFQAFDRAAVRPEALYCFASSQPFRGPQREGFLPEDEMVRRAVSVTHVADAGSELPRKLAAMACHETQALSVLGFMRSNPERLITETFHRVYPPVPRSAAVQRVETL